MSLKSPYVKIIAGRFKGVRLPVPATGTHPMGERERNAIMNVIGPATITGATVLDLFAGTGALGLEALSRGAKKAAFVESNPEAAKSLKAALKTLGLTSSTSVIKSKAETFTTTEKFDLVFVDPPYDHPEFFQDMSYCTNFVKKNGYLIISHPKNLNIGITDKLTLQKTKTYAGAAIAFFANL